jgi:cytochrome c-type biogenesis protein CcmH/NrfF
VWALPIAALICGAAALGVAFRKWRTADDGAVSAEDSALVNAAMASKNVTDSNS